jgi:hypothetical protein
MTKGVYAPQGEPEVSKRQQARWWALAPALAWT